jgi:uncharacterized protein YaaR (DUF327 family)
MKTKKKKKEKKVTNLLELFRNKADKKNEDDCKNILKDLNDASNSGEYSRTIQLKANQAHYIESLGLIVTEQENRIGYYEISWKKN